MKKRLFAVVGCAMLLFGLTSCKKTETIARRVDSPSSETIAKLNLDSVKNGIDAYEFDNTSKNYYDIKIAEDSKSTIVVYNTAIDSFLEQHGDRNERVNVAPLTFSGEITATEKTEILKNAYSSTTKLTKDLLNVGFEIDYGTNWGKSYSLKDVYKSYLDGQKNNYVSVAYIPLHVVEISNEVEILNVYVLIPLHVELTTIENNTNSYSEFNSLKTVELTFDESNTLLV